MPNIVRNPYSNTAGNTPSSLGNGQIGVNQADGRLFYRSSSGAVTTFSSIASYATSASFPATGASSSVLYLATDTSKLHQFTGSVYVEIGVAGGSGGGGGGPSSYTLPAATSSELGGVVVGAGLSIASGTVSANVVSVAGRTGAVTITSADVSGLGSLATASSVAASEITSGTVATARLGSGTADSTTYLRGDGAWSSTPTEVREFDTTASFPTSGQSSAVLHVATDAGKIYRWMGSAYIEVGSTFAGNAITLATLGAAPARSAYGNVLLFG